MSAELLAKVALMRAQSSAKAETEREAIREALDPDMAAFLDEWREGDPGMKLTYLKTPTLERGKPGERGLSVGLMVIDDLRPKAQAPEVFRSARKR